jgi:hypothetical protein
LSPSETIVAGVKTYGLCLSTTMLPSMAYDCVSVLPAGGRNVSTATAMNEPASNGLTGKRAPRESASRPAPTPIAPIAAAPQAVKSTSGRGAPRYTHQGGAPSGACAIAGTTMEGPMADIANISSSETVMQTAAVHTSPRGDPMARTIRLLTVFTPTEDASRFASLRRRTGPIDRIQRPLQDRQRTSWRKLKMPACREQR